VTGKRLLRQMQPLRSTRNVLFLSYDEKVFEILEIHMASRHRSFSKRLYHISGNPQ